MKLSIEMNHEKTHKKNTRSSLGQNLKYFKINVFSKEQLGDPQNKVESFNKSSVINLYSDKKNNLYDSVLHKSEEELDHLACRINRWILLYEGVFQRTFDKHFFLNQQLPNIDIFSFKQNILLKRGAILFQKKTDLEKTKNQLKYFQDDGNSLSNLTDFCSNMNSRRELSLFFAIKNKKIDSFKIKYNYGKLLKFETRVLQKPFSLSKVFNNFLE